jgi:chitinase
MKLGLALALLLATAASSASSASVVMCYFSTAAAHREGDGHFDVEDIDPALCTHLMYAFAGLDREQYVVTALDPDYDLGEAGGYARFNALKTSNADLLTFLTIGGWAEGKLLGLI